MTLKASTKRSLRSGFHALIAVLTVLPLLASSVAAPEKAAGVVAAVAVVSKVVNALEDAGLIPAWLKDGAATPAAPAEDTEGP